MSVPVLEVRGLTVAYDDATALRDVDLEVGPGTSVAVIGPNGSGKSTLLHAVAGLVEPSAGRVTCDRSDLGLVLQSTEVDRSLPITVVDVVRMARYPHRGLLGRFRPRDRAAVERAMGRMEVTPLAHRQLHDLSGGQRQRVMVAQGLAQEAGLLLLDEPVTGLDVVSRGLILEAVADEVRAGRTVVMTTHDLADARRCDLVVLVAGRMVAMGPPQEVIREDHLRTAFGERVSRLDDGELFVDDPHHDHALPHHGRG